MTSSDFSRQQTVVRLIGSCADRPGLVAKVAGYISGRGGNIVEAGQHQDHQCGVFFMRYEVMLAQGDDEQKFRANFAPLAAELGMDWHVTNAFRKKRVAVLVSQHGHCLADLLYRWKFGDLYCDIVGVISNHRALEELVAWNGVPFYHVPVPSETQGREAAFFEVARLLNESSPDLVVLARYMQILPAWLCERYPNRIINIHHSFLPSFAGANPYRQAVERGVKLIGATCHFVTAELDAGPIIEQDVVRVRHNDCVANIMRLGKDAERLALYRGLNYCIEDKVLVYGNKTIIFY
jgi:formyltetrahydrofolate deformylase